MSTRNTFLGLCAVLLALIALVGWAGTIVSYAQVTTTPPPLQQTLNAQRTLSATTPVAVAAAVPLPAGTAGRPAPQLQAPDYWPTDGWRSSTPEEQGMDSALLADGMRYLLGPAGGDLHSLLIVRHGYVVLDAVFDPYQAGLLHDVASVTKSVTATVAGLAIDQGTLSLDDTVLEFFADRPIAHLDAAKQAITVEDLLRMRSGLDCVDQPVEVTMFEMLGQPDWVQYVLDRPMMADPGAQFVYCSPAVHLLSAVIQQATGLSTADYAEQHLFAPLGITQAGWPSGPGGVSRGWGDLHLAPHDMARIGFLYLHGGQWDGQQLLAPEWVTAATSGNGNYGYLWWLYPAGRFAARGRGGQNIMVLPDADMVIVTTAGGGDSLSSRLVPDYILPAAQSDEPLPPNPAGLADLEAVIAEAAAPAAYEIVTPKPLPPIAQAVAGTSYQIDPNPLGVLAVGLTFPEDGLAVLDLVTTGGQQQIPIGLDGVPRMGTGEYGGIVQARGTWTANGTLVVIYDEITNINRWTLTVRLAEDTITVRAAEGTGLGVTVLQGHRAPA